jgi:hypothetical protein
MAKKRTLPKICQEAKMNFEGCELAILRSAIDEAEHIQSTKTQIGPEIKKIIEIVEQFLRHKKLICYGGSAINAVLPRNAQFYDYEVEIPDYDFFSTDSVADAKELADIYYKNGYKDVEAKSGVHSGTQKVYVNMIPIADITLQNPIIFKELQKDAVVIDGIHYCPPDFLRMGLYMELCRPRGDVSRWEKVLTRLILLNRHYPLKGKNCYTNSFQRKTEEYKEEESEKIYNIIRDVFMRENVVFFGGYALSIYSTYMPKREQGIIQKIADFDVLTEDMNKTARLVVEQLKQNGFRNARAIPHIEVGEILPKHTEIRIGANETVAFIYEPEECVNYNVLKVSAGQDIRVATIDTILRYYLAFLYTKRPYYDKERLICMSDFLFRVQQENRLEQRGVLHRFSMSCVGKQKTLEEIRAEKAEVFKKLKDKKTDPEYQKWFLRYIPAEGSKHEAVVRAPQEAVVRAPQEAVVRAPQEAVVRAPQEAVVRATREKRFNRRRKHTRKNRKKSVYFY